MVTNILKEKIQVLKDKIEIRKKKKREGRREEELKEKTGDRIQKNYPKRIAAKILHRVLVDQGVERKGESDSNLY